MVWTESRGRGQRGRAFLRRLAWGLALYVGSTLFSACGACWPGSCPNAPSPEPTPAADCQISRQADSINPYLWQGGLSEDSDSCPRLLLDPADPRYDDSELCEIGVRRPSEESANDAFFVRFDCDNETPWEIVLTEPASPEASDEELTIQKSCPEVPLDQRQTFTYGQALEPELWAASGAEIGAVATEWEEGCQSADASDERKDSCSQVCERIEKGSDYGISLRRALAKFDIPTSSAVDCYLALFDEVPASAGESIGTSGESVAPISGTSACLCRPNDLFFDIVTEGCFPDSSTYEASCGQAAWGAAPSSGDDCASVPVQ